MRNLRILLVEDSPLLAARLQEMLAQVPGVELVATTDTERGAIEKARACPIDAIILDLQLKTGTGFGVLRSLGTPRPIVVVLTNFAVPALAQCARDLGAEHFLDKAHDMDRLAGVVAAIGKNLLH